MSYNAAAGHTGLLTATTDMMDVVTKHADNADEQGRLAPEVVEGIRTAGFGRHFVSPALGGSGGTFREVMHAAALLGHGCASAAWCAALFASSARFGAHLPQLGHETVWAEGPDALLVTGLVPSGRARRDQDGFTLTGRWGYISGVEFADWVLLCATIEGTEPPELRFFALRRDQVQIIESWDCAGMKATGSHTVLVDGARVPSYLTFDRQDMNEGINRWSTLSSHNVPYQALGGPMLAVPAVGAAQGAVAAAAEELRGKRLTDAAQTELARAAARVDSAWALLERCADVIDERDFSPLNLATNQRNASFAAEQAGKAVIGLVRAAGTSGLSQSGRLHRFWRDVTAATTHVALRYDITRAAANFTTELIAAGPTARAS